MVRWEADLQGLGRSLDHRFHQPQLLADAVTHPSLGGLDRTSQRAGQGAGQGVAVIPTGVAYERLEFLGDRVLGLVIASWLLERFPSEREGSLARRHAALVRREALSRVAEAIELGRYLRLSPGEDDSGGRNNQAILADCCEAVIGALYLDGGLEAAEKFIRTRWAQLIERDAVPPQDAKTALQEWAQGRGKPLPVYETVRQSGPAHEPLFEIRVHVEGVEPVTAQGSSKRTAEKLAASSLLRQVGVPIDD
jgi:ribonuclease III